MISGVNDSGDWDACINNTTLVEYYCENAIEGRKETYICPNSYTCQDGACKPIITNPPLSSKCADGSTCSWCGSSCVKSSIKSYCPTVAPPLGAQCVCENNQCVVKSGGTTSLNEMLNQLTASLISLLEFLKR